MNLKGTHNSRRSTTRLVEDGFPQVIIKVVDNSRRDKCGKKIKELVENLPASTQLQVEDSTRGAVMTTGEIIRGTSKDATLIFQIPKGQVTTVDAGAEKAVVMWAGEVRLTFEVNRTGMNNPSYTFLCASRSRFLK